MKILYAAGNNCNARIQLTRFLQAMKGSNHQIKIAAYKLSSPKNISIDWTLDCLFNIYKPDLISLENDNLNIYFDQVKYYNPDLIISDLEYFTSYIAGLLEISIWQCSSSIINIALTKNDKYNMGAFKFYAHILNRNFRHNQQCINLLDNSNGNFVYSHFGDTADPPKLLEGFEWIRPYHQIGKTHIPCHHFMVAGLSYSNKQALGLMKKINDTVVFIDSPSENYDNPQVKDIVNHEEYFCNIKNSNIFLCQGQTSFLADAFYNGKYSLIFPDYQDSEATINSAVSQHLHLGHIINLNETFENNNYTVTQSYNSSIKYLHEKVNEL